MKDKPEDFWKQKLSPEQYHVCREGGTEMAFTGKYYKSAGDGMYHCAACGSELFSSHNKFDSGTGWPSFDRPFSEESVEYREDKTLGMNRTEVICRKCGSHLGHVFEDGPKETTGKRFCINSLALDFETGDHGKHK